MSRIVWLNDAFVDARDATLPIDDPGVRHGLGLFETMRAQDGRVPWLEDHIARITRSAAELGLVGLPDPSAVARTVERVADAAGSGAWRLRLSVTTKPTLLVEAVELAPGPAELSAITVRGAWHRGRRLAEHKTLSYMECALAQQQAKAAGADVALLLDNFGALGEASIANVMCVIGGRIVTTPADGLLPGIARTRVMAIADVEERALSEPEWRAADEIFATNALRGVMPITVVDSRPVGDGQGMVTSGLAERLPRFIRPV